MTGHDRLGGRTSIALATALAVLAVAPALAQTPTPRPAPLPTPGVKPVGAANTAALEAARLVWDALSLADRVAIQDGLVWSGDYSGSLDGTFGRMTFEAIAAFQARNRFAADGILTAPALKLLGESTAAKKTAFGFQPVDDKATGVRIHLPTKLLGPAIKRDAGSRWVGREGRLQVETFAYAETDLAPLYERMKADVPGRKVVYAVLRPDWFVVSDEAGGRHGYARFVRGAQGIRGFLFIVDASLGPEFDRVVIATAGRFEPFPGALAATPTTPTATPGGTTPQPLPTPTPTPAAPVSVAAPASGLVVAPGRVVTAAAAVAGCTTLAAAGRPATVVTADAGGFATLAVTGGAAGPIRTGTASGPLTVVASGDGAGRPGIVAIPGDAADGRLRAPLQRGAQGAPVLAADGGLVGLVLGRPDEKRLVAGLVPQATYDIGDAAALAAAIGAAGGTPEPAAGAPLTTGRLVATWASRVVAIDCRR